MHTTRGIIFFGMLLGLAAEARAQELESYLHRRVEQIQLNTQRDLAEVTRENWTETSQLWRSELRAMLGIPADIKKTPLASQTTGTIDCGDLLVHRLHYQSRPGLYVGANLYVPKTTPTEDGFPAVLYVCGHARATDGGRLLGNKTAYQHHGLWFARNGFVCLMIDTVQLGEFHGEHHGTYKLGRWDWVSRGFTPAGVEAWNAIRGVDLLTSLDYVDSSRIGITGRSGGGAYSWFAAALDDRIAAAVPVAGITDLKNHVVDGCVEGHCDCMYFVNYFGWDYAKLAALVAPRPLLLENSDSDRIFPLDGVVRIDSQLRRIYRRLGAENNYGLVVTPGPHKDTQDLRVPAFRFLAKHLLGDADFVVENPASKEISQSELAVFDAEVPKDERVAAASGWFGPQVDETDEVTLEVWRQERLPQLHQRRVLPSEVKATEFKRTSTADSSEPEWESVEGISMMRIGPAKSRKTIVHWMLDQSQWSPRRVKQCSETWPAATHYFVAWRGSNWKVSGDSDLATAKEQTQFLRRFHLIGESLERLALSDFLSAWRWITANQAGSISLAASGREATLAMIAALMSNWEELDIQKPEKLFLDQVPLGVSQSACIPGLFQVITPSQLLSVAQQASEVIPISFDSTPNRDWVDPEMAPQQASGMKVVEVTDSQAKIWVRATQYALPNLGDLPEVQFKNVDGKHSWGAILPERGVEGLRYAVPGVRAEIRVGHRGPGQGWKLSPWAAVEGATDFSKLVDLEGLEPGTRYEVQTQVRGIESGETSTLRGSFTTLPSRNQPADGFRLAIGTCQSFIDRDGPHGFDMYRTMLNRNTDAFVLAGDVVYYDRLARSKKLAYYHWQRTYSLPTLVDFHKRVPSYFLKDDHDTYVNDSWPGQSHEWTDDFAFVDGQQIFMQQTGLPTPAYRTFQIGRDLQVWLMEGRDFRTANTMPDGPEKTIWGTQQRTWLKETLENSKATFKVVISPTPIVGPDRKNKRDNHANANFAAEGSAVRAMLADFENTVVVCGDRHWQFHSVDPKTGLHEFSVGPTSDRHAGGWKQNDYRPEFHRYLRVGGGYVEIELHKQSGPRRLVIKHLDTHGKEHHRHVLTSSTAGE